MVKKNVSTQKTAASLKPERAIELLEQQLAEVDDLDKLDPKDSEVEAWESCTRTYLDRAFGVNKGGISRQAWDLLYGGIGVISVGDPEPSERERRAKFLEENKRRRTLLRGNIKTLQADLPHEKESETGREREGNAIERVLRLLRRFPRTAHRLSEEYRKDREGFGISDEYDVQHLLYAMFQIDFDDIRPEEYGPSVAGGSPRMDVLLKNEKIVVEVKKTRQNLKDKELGEELLVDIGKYPDHPDCKILVCFVYDPEHLLKNPSGLRRDLEARLTTSCPVHVVIVPSD